jgi:hypothetical protein
VVSAANAVAAKKLLVENPIIVILPAETVPPVGL